MHFVPFYFYWFTNLYIIGELPLCIYAQLLLMWLLLTLCWIFTSLSSRSPVSFLLAVFDLLFHINRRTIYALFFVSFVDYLLHLTPLCSVLIVELMYYAFNFGSTVIYPDSLWWAEGFVVELLQIQLFLFRTISLNLSRYYIWDLVTSSVVLCL